MNTELIEPFDLKIGYLTPKNPIALAPMAGITDLPYRIINREFGCEFAFTEMINIKGFLYNSKKTLKMLLGLLVF